LQETATEFSPTSPYDFDFSVIFVVVLSDAHFTKLLKAYTMFVLKFVTCEYTRIHMGQRVSNVY